MLAVQVLRESNTEACGLRFARLRRELFRHGGDVTSGAFLMDLVSFALSPGDCHRNESRFLPEPRRSTDPGSHAIPSHHLRSATGCA